MLFSTPPELSRRMRRAYCGRKLDCPAITARNEARESACVISVTAATHQYPLRRALLNDLAHLFVQLLRWVDVANNACTLQVLLQLVVCTRQGERTIRRGCQRERRKARRRLEAEAGGGASDETKVTR